MNLFWVLKMVLSFLPLVLGMEVYCCYFALLQQCCFSFWRAGCLRCSSLTVCFLVARSVKLQFDAVLANAVECGRCRSWLVGFCVLTYSGLFPAAPVACILLHSLLMRSSSHVLSCNVFGAFDSLREILEPGIEIYLFWRPATRLTIRFCFATAWPRRTKTTTT